jgi:hypothetical protein
MQLIRYDDKTSWTNSIHHALTSHLLRSIKFVWIKFDGSATYETDVIYSIGIIRGWNGQETFSLSCELWVGTNDFNTKKNSLVRESTDNFPEWKLALKAHFHSRKFSTDRKFSENIIVKSWKFSTSEIFSHRKFVSANHILQNFLSAENFPEWKLTVVEMDHKNKPFTYSFVNYSIVGNYRPKFAVYFLAYYGIKIRFFIFRYCMVKSKRNFTRLWRDFRYMFYSNDGNVFLLTVFCS